MKENAYPTGRADVILSDTGDAFLAGLIYNYLQKKSWKELLDFSCRIGAYVASQKGANPEYDMDTISKLHKFDS